MEQSENSTRIPQNEQVKVSISLDTDKKDIKLTSTENIRIDVRGFIKKLTRKYNISVYYNKNSWCQLQGNEIQNMYDVLLFLYKKKQEFIDGKLKKEGVSLEVLTKCKSSRTGRYICYDTVNRILWELNPVVLNSHSYECKNKHLVKYFSLNKNGVKSEQNDIPKQNNI
jgi:hypothetical protein